MKKDYEKLYKKWRVIGIALIIFVCIILISSIALNLQERVEDNKMKICFYEICANYPDADYYDDVCSCYDYDTLGRLTIAKEEYMK